MKALLIYYSFTGQAQRAVEIAAAACREQGVEPVICRIDFADPALRLRKPLSIADAKRWTKAAASGERLPLAVEPAAALQGRYDFVGLFSNTWQDHPAVPVRSLLALPEMQALLRDTPFAVYVICRWLWQRNARIVRAEAEAAGGRFIDAARFEHHGGPVFSLLGTLGYLLSAGDGFRVFGWRVPAPPYGLAATVPQRIRQFTERALASVRRHSPPVA